METFVDIISDIGAQISKIKRCRVNQQTLNKDILNTDLQNIYSFPFLSFSPSLWLRNSKATRMER